MPEITELLDGTTPRDVPPVDVADLARRAHARQRRQRIVTVAAGVAVVLGGLATGIALWPDAEPDLTTEPTVDIDLDEPIGRWSAAADPPFSVADEELFTTRLSDGRVLAWGGRVGADDNGLPIYGLDGGIYDPDTDSWEYIPEAPLAPLVDYWVGLEKDRLAVVPVEARADGPRAPVVYDVHTDAWHTAPGKVEPSGEFRQVFAWDGEVLALVFLPVEESEAGVTTSRWRLGEDDWQEGAPWAQPPPPDLAGAAFDGARLAVWGGGTGGAIYDVAADTWQEIPEAPISDRNEPTALWWRGQLLVGGGEGRALSDDEHDDLVAYDPRSNDWTELPPAPDVARLDPGSPPYGGEGYDQTDFPLSPAAGGSFDTSEAWWFLDEDGWHDAPFRDLHDVGGLVVATSVRDPATQRAFGVAVRTEDGEWLGGAAPPFAGPVAAAEVSDTKVVALLGGGTWVLDLAAG